MYMEKCQRQSDRDFVLYQNIQHNYQRQSDLAIIFLHSLVPINNNNSE